MHGDLIPDPCARTAPELPQHISDAQGRFRSGHFGEAKECWRLGGLPSLGAHVLMHCGSTGLTGARRQPAAEVPPNRLRPPKLALNQLHLDWTQAGGIADASPFFASYLTTQSTWRCVPSSAICRPAAAAVSCCVALFLLCAAAPSSLQSQRQRQTTTPAPTSPRTRRPDPPCPSLWPPPVRPTISVTHRQTHPDGEPQRRPMIFWLDNRLP